MLKETFTETINTERLVLRKFESSDVESVFNNWASDLEVQVNYGEPVYSSTAEVKALLEKYISGYECANYYRWAVIEKCGLTYEGTLRDYFKMPDGSFESRMYFSILRDEIK